MLTVFFREDSVIDFVSAAASDTSRYASYFRANLRNGVMLAPSQFEAAFVSTAHSDNDITETIELARKAFKEVVR